MCLSQRTRRDESTRVLCAGSTDAEAAPRRLARSQHTRHIGVTRNCSPTLMSNCQVCCPTGHHRFGFSSRHPGLISTNLYLRSRWSHDAAAVPDPLSTHQTFHFPAEQSANIVTGHQRATNFFKSARRVALDQNGHSNSTHGPCPPHPPEQCQIVHFTPLRSVHHQNNTCIGNKRTMAKECC